MKKQYDFSNAVPNPYASKLKQQITIRLDEGVVTYFKNLAESFGMPYQNLINLYLRECAAEQKLPEVKWLRTAGVGAGERTPRRK